jgi:hypothetical protein
MASFMKFTHPSVVNQIRHVFREIAAPSNVNIDATRTEFNYTLSPERGVSAYSYYLVRKKQLHCLNRANVNTLIGWVVTVPRNLLNEEQILFFKETYLFLENRYGQENTVLAIVHLDENRPHLHFLFIPAVVDLKRGGEKICANELMTREELRNFHPALQKHMNDVGINARIISYSTEYRYFNKNDMPLRKFEQYLREARE